MVAEEQTHLRDKKAAWEWVRSQGITWEGDWLQDQVHPPKWSQMQRPTCCGPALTQPPDLSLALIQLPLQLPLPGRHLPDEIQALALRPAGAGGSMAGRRKTWPRRRGMRQRRCRRMSRSACTRMGRLTSPGALLPPPVNLPPRCLKSSSGIPGHLYQHNVLICKAPEKKNEDLPYA